MAVGDLLPRHSEELLLQPLGNRAPLPLRSRPKWRCLRRYRSNGRGKAAYPQDAGGASFLRLPHRDPLLPEDRTGLPGERGVQRCCGYSGQG